MGRLARTIELAIPDGRARPLAGTQPRQPEIPAGDSRLATPTGFGDQAAWATDRAEYSLEEDIWHRYV